MTYQATVNGDVMTAEKRLLREVDSYLLRHSDVGCKHELLNELMGLVALIRTTINGKTLVVKFNCEAPGFQSESTSFESTSTKLLSNIVENLNVVLNRSSIVITRDSYSSQAATVNDTLSVGIGKLRGRTEQIQQ